MTLKGDSGIILMILVKEMAFFVSTLYFFSKIVIEDYKTDLELLIAHSLFKKRLRTPN